jgi:23S rRNA pseudouridine1911/1915/1917 synthase
VAASRIVRRLAALYPAETASRLKRAVLEGQVSVDGAIVDDPGALVTEAQKVVFDPNRKVQRRIETPLTILHEDADAIAVVKPAGLLTHPTDAEEPDTLLSRVSEYVARKEGRRRGPGPPRSFVSLVQRLDRDTSGVVVLAKSRGGVVLLQGQLRSHTMDRAYQAVVEGDVKGPQGVIEWNIVEDRGDGRRGVDRTGEHGVRAVTRWRVVERFGVATLVEARLETGKQHQIRIHFAALGHPVVGDPVYRDPRRPPFPVAFPRQALHAGQLGWTSATGQKVSVRTEPPADFTKLVETLRRRARAAGRAAAFGGGAPPPAPPGDRGVGSSVAAATPEGTGPRTTEPGAAAGAAPKAAPRRPRTPRRRGRPPR